MRAAFFFLVMVLSGSAEAQRIRLSGPTTGGTGGGSATLDPARNDTASSYTATGPNGLKTAPAANVGALGGCAALSGAYASAVPTTETQPSPYFCGGVAWRRIWTDEEGITASPDRSLPAYTFVSQAMAGAFAFKSNNRGVWDFGDGINDECRSVGTAVECGSWRIASGQSLTADTIAPTTGATNLTISTPAYMRILPVAVAGCGAGQVGGFQTLSTDGNKPHFCDGVANFRISRILPVPVTFDFPSVANGGCTTANVTVTGAALGDIISVNADFALPSSVGIGNVRTVATDTVSLRLCNNDLTNSADPDSGIYRFRLER